MKQDATGWINKQRFIKAHFNWQSSYGTFSHSKSQVPQVIRYISRQEEIYAKKPFQEEYLEILQKNDLEYEERYIFEGLLCKKET